MRHRREGYKLGRDKEQREALYRGLMISLIEHRKIKTTITKCKAIQPYIESLITLGRIDNPHNRRMALSRLALRTPYVSYANTSSASTLPESSTNGRVL